MRTHYKNVRDSLLAAIRNSPFAHRIHIYGEDAGLHFLMQIDTKKSDEELLKIARRHNIHIALLSQYYIEPLNNIPEHTLILNYTGLSPNQITTAVEMLSDIFHDLPK